MSGLIARGNCAAWRRFILMVPLRRVVLSLLLGCGIMTLGACEGEPEAVNDRPKVVDATRVKPANGHSTAVFSGRVAAAEQTALSFEIPGEIERLTVEVGERFKSGDVLAVLNDDRYQLVHDRALAAEREAKAALEERKLDYERQSSLQQQGFISESRLDSAKAALDTARSRHESAVASRRLAERDLQLTTLSAPFTGSVSQRLVEPSERVNPNQVVLRVISHQDGFEVETSVPENLVGQLTLESEQIIRIPALGGKDITASIQHIGSQPRTSNNYPIILVLNDIIPGLHSGMTAQVHLSMPSDDKPAQGLAPQSLIPLTAVVYDGEGRAHVLRLTETKTDGEQSGSEKSAREQRLEKVEVTIVSVEEEQALVSGDLRAGDTIVARGAEFVAEGEAVTVLGQGPEQFN